MSKEEYQALRQNIYDAGCARDPLSTWNGILLDGHNRLDICQKFDFPFTTVEIPDITGREDAMIWIIQNQFGRRNLTPFARAELALKLEPLFAQKARAIQFAMLRQNLKEESPVLPTLAKRDGGTVEVSVLPTLAKRDDAFEAGLPMLAKSDFSDDLSEDPRFKAAMEQIERQAEEDNRLFAEKLKEIRRAEVVQTTSSIKPVHTRAEIARAAGVSHGTLDKAKVISARGTEEQKERLRKGASSIHKEYESVVGRREPSSNACLVQLRKVWGRADASVRQTFLCEIGASLMSEVAP